MGEGIVDVAIIKESSSLSMKATPPFLYKSSSSIVFFAFPGLWSVDDWKPTAAPTPSDNLLSFLPSLRTIGSNETALLHAPFFHRFLAILTTSTLQHQVHKAVTGGKQIVMTGHSSGGSIAIIATVWLLEQFRKLNQLPPLCLTFGSPLVGDSIFGHALRREAWSSHFSHFILRYDIVPRLLLTPFDSIEQQLQTILPFLDQKSPYSNVEALCRSPQAVSLVSTVMRNTSLVASHGACLSMDCTNMLLEALPSFIKLSPFRPVGTYIFCTGNGKLLIVKNSDVVLQLLSYCLQLGPKQDLVEVVCKCLKEHLAYEFELRESFEMQDIVSLDHLEQLPLSLEDASSDEMQSIDMALKDLGLSMEARLCLRATRESEKHKQRNLYKIEANRNKIQEALNMLDSYRETCKIRQVGYYDAFKLQKDTKDFNANLKRLDLAGLWDEIIEMLKRYELPDDFESRIEWVQLGTRYRCLVEPLDIANYYRHFKNEDTGPYMVKGRPTRYRFTQRWLEHAEGMIARSTTDSCFWAKVEELCLDTASGKGFEEISGRVLELENELSRGINGASGRDSGVRDVFLEGSTFVKWWKNLPQQHRLGSCIARYISGEGRNASSFFN
ncbi:protein EDS1L-like [Magnolia sinica]|uniref:protein EDS1L-like n=1 Tax=Magnolia sinica TaxID=86752 RepID=UPI00265965AA|nr:protein EDS1L-like [Magnolia sinica]